MACSIQASNGCSPPLFTNFAISDSLPLRSGSKRRARTPRIHEEESNTQTSLRLRSRVVGIHEPQYTNQISTKVSTSGNGRSKRIVQNNETLSPSKSDTHLKPTKPLDSMFLVISLLRYAILLISK